MTSLEIFAKAGYEWRQRWQFRVVESSAQDEPGSALGPHVPL